MNAARVSMQRCYRLALPLIQQEEAAARAKAEEEKRQEAVRIRNERIEAARREKEQHDAEVARLAALQLARQRQSERHQQAGQQAALILQRAVYIHSEEFARLSGDADSIMNSLAATISMEDSAYRGMSEGSEGARTLLAIYVKIEGNLNGTDVSADVDQQTALADRTIALETSAIRSIYENDEGFFRLLGTWCQVLEKRHPDLVTAYREEDLAVTSRLADDDSAPRAISAYTKASMRVLQKIVADEASASEAQRITTTAESLNAAEDSAWRATTLHSEAILQLLLTLFPQTRAAEAERIRSSVGVEQAGEDSALRAEIHNQQGIAAALHELILHP
jgi:hypothetical protein